MKTLKRLAASSFLSLAMVAGTVGSALAEDTIIITWECRLLSTTIDWETGTITDNWKCEPRQITIIYE